MNRKINHQTSAPKPVNKSDHLRKLASNVIYLYFDIVIKLIRAKLMTKKKKRKKGKTV